ncbi:polysaccharide deacetylase family protein [Streptomyces pristinaespiralis]|jgi:peptidoglycan/xylan/chitin deacetylase (PgdA/CDA1 family)|uniref:Polysaccharide deacetylase n=1 Tax=Streptomyces pristinaespiralis TaxID=38300 RepID=A0A0M4DRS0_STRPR|nr:polysaccharide deacetylase family protein [Streptomyces pristinaespiralis]ALC21195.1 polysaccharide deacetylase [Streptomyces pristinaespiralis]QMU16053.1 polysaccharide deacetylase family protein [Streptomyces pristinaespiralis]
MTTDTAAPAAAPALDQPWILMYHTVADPTDDPYGIAVAPDRLELQLRWLRARGLRGVGVADLLRARTAGDAAGLVGLTFDDGYADFVETALPILARYDCTATVFVLPGRLGGTNEWDAEGPRRALLTGRQIRAAAEAGTEIASHGLFHHRLPGCPDDVLLEETVRSRELLCELTGTAPAGFCYPYGTFDRRAADAVRRAGYSYACAIAPGAEAGPYALPRTHISQADRGARLWAKRLRHRARRLPALGPVHLGGAG